MKSSQFDLAGMKGVKTDLFPERSAEEFREAFQKMNEAYKMDIDRLGINRINGILHDSDIEGEGELNCGKCAYNIQKSRLVSISNSKFRGYSEGEPLYAAPSTSYPSNGALDCGLETIYIDMVLFYHLGPMLFTCLNPSKTKVYICSRYHVDGDKVEWLVRQTTYDDIINLLTDKITINEIFTLQHNSLDVEIYKLTLDSSHFIRAERHTINDLPSSIFPTPGYYMDVSDGEFDEEILELRKRQINNER